MASRYAHDETCALCDDSAQLANAPTLNSKRAAWKRLALVAGGVLSVGAIGTAYHQTTGGHTIHTSTVNLASHRTHTGQDNGFVVDGRQQLRSMLLKTFGLAEPPSETPPSTPSTPPSTPSTPTAEATGSAAVDESDAVKAANKAQAKAELREALLQVLDPKHVATQAPIITAIANATHHTENWNWLHPSVDTYSLVAESSQRDGDVSVRAVYEYLRNEGKTRTHKLLSEMIRTETQYQRTLHCFQQGVNHRDVLSRDEYDSLVQWMNHVCASDALLKQQEIQQEQQQHHTNHQFMTKAEFKALITSHFGMVLHAFHSGQATLQHNAQRAAHARTKIQSCIDLATERATHVDGLVQHARLSESIHWIASTCVDQ